MMGRIVVFRKLGRILTCLTFAICCRQALMAHDPPEPQKSGSDLQVKHILGFEGISNNTNGTLSVHDALLRFQTTKGAAGELSVGSIRDIALGAEEKQVGGVPMMLAKTAAPYGSGRVVSLFSHKTYDTLTLKYVDHDGGLHGAIFLLARGTAEALKKELVAAGAHTTPAERQAVKATTQEPANEVK